MRKLAFISIFCFIAINGFAQEGVNLTFLLYYKNTP
jgi:hypothetical protein